MAERSAARATHARRNRKAAHAARMFAAPEPTIYAISDDELMRTRAFGGAEPADAANGECERETGTAIAWDETRVVGTCNRGICVHTRSDWNEGHRICRGC